MNKSTLSEFQCPICEKTLTTKSNLSKHLRCVHRQKEDGTTNNEELLCTSRFCKFKTMYAVDLRRHVQKCALIAADKELYSEFEDFKSETFTKIAEYDRKLDIYEREIAKLQTEKEMLERQLVRTEKAHQQLAERAIDRPTNQHVNVKVTNFLSDFQTYQKQTAPEYVTHVARRYLENYFYHGQKGLARFLVEHVIKSDDGKVILCCTDPIRKRFRFVNGDSKLEEDIKAKMLSQKISVPIKQVCHEVFDKLRECLAAEKKLKLEEKAGAFEIGFVDDKLTIAGDQLMNLRDFDDENCNSDFLNELSSLLRGPTYLDDLEAMS